MLVTVVKRLSTAKCYTGYRVHVILCDPPNTDFTDENAEGQRLNTLPKAKEL